MDFVIAFVGGFLSFVSPCVFPLIPAYIALFAGVSLREIKSGERGAHARVVMNSFLFVLGFSLTFTLLGASASFVGNILKAHKREFTFLAGVLLFIFGLHLTGVLKIPFLLGEKRADVSRLAGKLPLSLFAFVSGFLFAFGWTPCIGPILAGILTLAASQEEVSKGVLLLFTYSMGLGVPFMLSAVFISVFLSLSAKVRRFMRAVEISSGVLLMLIALLFITGKLSVFSSVSLPNFEELALKLKGESREKIAGEEAEGERDGRIPYYDIYREIFRAEPVNGLLPSDSDFVIINFWATWCPPCKKEIPDFIKAVEKHQNLLVVGIAYDKDREKVKKFIAEMGINYPVFMHSDIAENYEPSGLPESILFYKGKFIGKVTGIIESKDIELFTRGDFSFLNGFRKLD